jgi:hypothetical protein
MAKSSKVVNHGNQQSRISKPSQFETVLQKLATIHAAKNNDYADEANPFKNFEESAFIVNMFRGATPIDQSFVVLIGTKLSRLGNLMSTNKEIKNESIHDTMIDLANYCAIWASYYEVD